MSTPTGKTYPIKTLEQIRRIPLDRRDALLSYLSTVLAEMDRVHATMKLELFQEISPTWTDDGEKVTRVTVNGQPV